MADASIANAIDKARIKWETKGSLPHARGMKVPLYFPVDKTSKTIVMVPYILCRLYSCTKDESPDSSKIFAPANDYTSTNPNRQKQQKGSQLPDRGKFQAFYRVWVELVEPIEWTRNSKQVYLREVGLNIPYNVGISGVQVGLAAHFGTTATSPSIFKTTNRTYRVGSVKAYDSAFLGERSDKSELPEAQQQEPEGGGSSGGGSPKK